jgi:D-alanine-D-alanine ligase
MTRVAILHDATAPERAETGPGEVVAVAAVLDVIADVERVAMGDGMSVRRVALSEDPRAMLRAVAAINEDVIVNLAECWRGVARFEVGVAWALELRGIPYTGADPRALALCLEKPLARAVLADAGVPVPRGFVAHTAEDTDAVPKGSAWIVKPAAQDASHGIDRESVVRGRDPLRARVAALRGRGIGPALIEEYIDGRELNASILEQGGAPRVLPIAEIDYAKFPTGAPRILTFASKWDPSSEDYRGSPAVPAELSPDLRARVEAVALGAWRALGLRSYGRVDLRLDARGPFVIDVNPNPDLSRGAGLCFAAERAGLSYEALVRGILAEARARARS